MDDKDISETFQSLKNLYNFQFHLKEEQIAVLRGLMNKRNVFAMLPTGYGKSMCFTLPPLLLDELDWTISHVAIVVSPLKSLMADQVNSLAEFGVRSIAVEPDMSSESIAGIKEGKFSVVFISPESATSKYWREIFLSSSMQKRVCLLACDEAHCISEWGEDFTPVYKEVLHLRSMFVEVTVLGVTATCNEQVRKDIFASLALDEECLTVAVVPDRPNIFLDIRESKQDYEKELNWLLEYLLRDEACLKKIIVYCRSVTSTAALYNHFKDCLLQKKKSVGIIDMFHRSIDEDSNSRILQSFKNDDSELRCLFSTVAFGMGVQIPNVELVVHWGVPKSVLCYWQEVGRGGQDGREAYAICYAYGRSLIKKITDERMIECAQTAKEACIRFTILKNLEIKGMKSNHLQGSGQSCTNMDPCPASTCYTFCAKKCSCGDKTIRGEFGIPS